MTSPLRLRTLAGRFAVCRLDPGAGIPEWARGEFVSIARTPDELSIICGQDTVPPDVRAPRGWVGLRVEGPRPVDYRGLAAGRTPPHAPPGISLLLVGTFDTDYLLVREETLERASAALREAGFELA